MFRTGDKADFDRMLDDILGRAKATAVETALQVEHEFAARGALLSSGTPVVMEQRITPIHDVAVGDGMRLIVQFSERTGIAISDLCEAARPKLATFTSDLTERMVTAANRLNLTQLVNQSRERFDRRTENALRDVEIGFIQGRSAIMTESPTNQVDSRPFCGLGRELQFLGEGLQRDSVDCVKKFTHLPPRLTYPEPM